MRMETMRHSKKPLFVPQIQEFVKWVFAQDKEISQGVKPKVTVKVSGGASWCCVVCWCDIALATLDKMGQMQLNSLKLASDALSLFQCSRIHWNKLTETSNIQLNQQSQACLSLFSGCSRADEFNGTYVQKEGEFYYRRPIFYCAENKKFLFYHGERHSDVSKKRRLKACQLRVTSLGVQYMVYSLYLQTIAKAHV